MLSSMHLLDVVVGKLEAKNSNKDYTSSDLPIIELISEDILSLTTEHRQEIDYVFSRINAIDSKNLVEDEKNVEKNRRNPL